MQIGIVGFGLIGGSIAKALKLKAGSSPITAVSRNENVLIQAKADGIIDNYSTDDFSVFKDCDIIFICTPVDKIAEYAKKLLPFVKKTCIITDAGSTKTTVTDAFRGLDVTFIGGHPMAGSEKSGYSAASEFLFENAFYILTPFDNTPPESLERLKSVITLMGALPIILPATKHDRIVAAISHVPHVIAALLVNIVRQNDDGNMRSLAAGGFKDITRIASSDPYVWQSICLENKTDVLHFLTVFKNNLDEFIQSLSDEDSNGIYNFFSQAKQYRDSFATSRLSPFIKTHDVYTDIIDKPGSIATVATLLSVNGINIKNIGIVNNRENREGVLHIAVNDEPSRERTVELLKNMNFIIYE